MTILVCDKIPSMQEGTGSHILQGMAAHFSVQVDGLLGGFTTLMLGFGCFQINPPAHSHISPVFRSNTGSEHIDGDRSNRPNPYY